MNRIVISAVQHVRKLRGGSQAHLLRASDGCYYVTKFQNNPQHVRVLANEFLASSIARALGLPVAPVEIIEVSDWLISHTPELRIEAVGGSFPCSSGLQLASRYAPDVWQDHIFDYVPETLLDRVANRQDMIQMLVFDKWAGNCDGRQTVFTKRRCDRLYRATFIDQGYCFNAAEWTFPDQPLHGAYHHKSVYHSVIGWDSFEPVLSKAEAFEYQVLSKIASGIPREWYQYDDAGLVRLLDALEMRRRSIRNLITAFRRSIRSPFPNWSDSSSMS